MSASVDGPVKTRHLAVHLHPVNIIWRDACVCVEQWQIGQHNTASIAVVSNVAKNAMPMLFISFTFGILKPTINKVDQLLWAWFSFLRKSADEIVEP